MATKRIAINGFGRIGRLVLRSGLKNENLEFVAFNDVANIEVLAYLFKYDTAYGPYGGTVEVADGNTLVVDGRPIRYISVKEPNRAGWGEMGVDYVVEATGKFTDTGKPDKNPMLHLDAGARRVLVTAPAKRTEDVMTVVLGVNQGYYDRKKHFVVSNASCTTNCLAPMVKVLQDNWGVEAGFMTTVHALTASQLTVDGPAKKPDPMDMRSGRAASCNIIPASTGAAKAIGLVVPEVMGKLTGMAFRVPTITGSAVDLVVQVARDTTLPEIGAAMDEASRIEVRNGGMKGILQYSQDPLVSSDIIGNRHSSIFDRGACIELAGNKRLFKLVAWYDNEFGYASRVVDLLEYMGVKEDEPEESATQAE
ncbi:MAG: type I glyceraldehyde-3-phosphate dehydrogenase [Deltaproteobacteria bacterium]|nr:type I glyceraldehyde-3-phosphate dehydrogenase [Deltaproteobacteria bacterium]